MTESGHSVELNGSAFKNNYHRVTLKKAVCCV